MSQEKEIIIIDGQKFEVKLSVSQEGINIQLVPFTDGPTDPPVITVPTELGTIKKGGWGADVSDLNALKVGKMTKGANKGKYEIIDPKDINVVTEISTEDNANKLLEFIRKVGWTEFSRIINEAGVDPNPPPVDPTPTTGEGKGVDKYGTKLLVADGSSIEYEFRENFRDDGKRFDFKIPNADKGTEAQGYFAFSSNPVDDEVSIKWSEVSHSGTNPVQCYDSGVSIKTGKTRMRFENPHPEYSGNLGGGQGVPLNDKFIGYKRVWIPNADQSVTVRLYQDAGNNEGDKPANEWKEVYSYTDTKYKRSGPHPEVTLRIDDPAKQGQKNLKAKWLSVARITGE